MSGGRRFAMQTMRHELETSLCRLRPLLPTDGTAIFHNYASDEDVTRYVVWPTHHALGTTNAFVAEAIDRHANSEIWTWCITQLDADECIGMVGVTPTGHRGEIGYVLGRPYWGRGVMTAVVRAVMHWCFHDAGLKLVWATCAVPNLASARVLEKAGMEKNGLLRGWHVFPNFSSEPQDCYIYSRLLSAA